MNYQSLTMHALFEHQVANNAHHVALVVDEKSYSYSELNEKANQLANFLCAQNIKPDDLIALCFERSLEMIISMLAILKAGAAFVPLDPTHPPGHLQTLLDDCKPKIIITMHALREKFTQFQGILIDADDKTQFTDYPTTNPASLAQPNNLGYVIYTSGSTGKPKAVLIEHHTVVNFSIEFGHFIAAKYPDRIDFSGNYIFDMAIATHIAPLMLGLSVVICPERDKLDLEAYLHYLAHYQVNIIKLTPSYFAILTQEAKARLAPLRDLKTIVLGGENLPTEVCRDWLKLYPHHSLINEYGPTEATVAITQYPITNENLKKLATYVPMGKPVSNVVCYILDTNNQKVPVNTKGELHIGGDCLARGYLNQPEMTEKKFIATPFGRLYKTGDIAYYLPDGNIQYCGRIDDQIKIRGFRIEPNEIASHLKTHEHIHDAVVVAIVDEAQKSKQLAAYYILRDSEAEITEHQLRAYLKLSLPEYKIPTYFVPMIEFPLANSGKIDKKALPKPMRSVAKTVFAPRSPIENTIAKIWETELGLKQIGVKENFFELGGDSLTAARIMTKIKNKLKIHANINGLYQYPTIAELAAVCICTPPAPIPLPHPEKTTSAEFQKTTLTPLSEFQFMYWVASLVVPKAKQQNIIDRKRLCGKLDVNILTRAFQALFVEQEILLYHPTKVYPALYVPRKHHLKIIEENISHLQGPALEAYLIDAYQSFETFHHWRKNSPLIVVKLFFLNNDETELQICLNHIIADEASTSILFSRLSDLYLLLQQKLPLPHVNTHSQYRYYIEQEWQSIHANLKRDIKFWKSYLKDTTLLMPPTEYVITDTSFKSMTYSTYVELSDNWFAQLQQRCTTFQVNVSTVISALIGMALAKYHTKQSNILLNVIKSTHVDECFDKTIGCFLHLDAIKIETHPSADLANIIHHVKNSLLTTASYQTCPGMVKFACLNFSNTKLNWLEQAIRHYFVKLYSKLLHKHHLTYKILSMYSYLIFKPRNGFMINVNIWNNFISPQKINKLFGLSQSSLPFYHHDLITVNNVLEFSFFYDDNQQKRYMVISGNLHPSFREMIAKKMIEGLL